MTLDKFGRHLLKRSRAFINSETDTITSSRYIFYNQVLSFESNKIVDGKYLIRGDNSLYLFPLESATIENLRVNNSDVNLSVNGNIVTKENVVGFPLKLNDEIAFVSNKNKAKHIIGINPLFVEIIIKCYVKFENMSVSAEVAYYKE